MFKNISSLNEYFKTALFIQSFIGRVVLLFFILGFYIQLVHAKEVSGNRSADVLSIAFPTQMPPLSFINEKNKADGFIVELWRAWSEQAKIDIAFVPMEQEDFIAQLDTGKIGISAFVYDSYDSNLIDNSITVVELKNSVYFLKEDFPSGLKTLNDLDNIGIVQGSAVEDALKEQRINKLRYYKSYYALADACINGEVTVIAGVDTSLEYVFAKKKIRAFFDHTDKFNLPSVVVKAGVSKKNIPLLNIVRKEMGSIADAKKQEIIYKKISEILTQNLVTNVRNITVGVQENAFPLSFYDSDKEISGFLVDIWKLWAKKTNISVKFWGGSHAEILDGLLKGDVDTYLGLFSNDSINEDLLYGSSLGASNVRLFYRQQDATSYSLADLSGQVVGIISATLIEDFLVEWFPDIEIKQYDNSEKLVQALLDKEVLAVLGNSLLVHNYIRRKGLDDKITISSGKILRQLLMPVVSHKHKDLLNVIEGGFNQINSNEKQVVQEFWNIQLSDLKETISRVKDTNLTNEEKLWLKNHSIVNVAVQDNIPPLSFFDASGTQVGVVIDYLDLLEEKLDIVFNIKSYSNWPETYDAFYSKEADIMPIAFFDDEKADKFYYSQSYLDLPAVIVTKDNNVITKGMKDLKYKEVAVIPAMGVKKVLKSEYKDIVWEDVVDHETALSMVSSGKISAAILSSATAFHLISSLKYHDLSVSFDLDLVYHYRIASQKEFPQLNSLLNKALNSITSQERKAIEEKWFGLEFRTWHFNKDIIVGLLILFVVASAVVYWNRRLSSEVRERRSIEIALMHRAESDRILSNISRQFIDDSLDNAIYYTLKTLNEFMFLSGTYLITYNKNYPVKSIPFHYFNRDISHEEFTPDKLIQLLTLDYDPLHVAVKNGQVCQLQLEEMDKSSYPKQYDFMKQTKIHAMICVPITLSGQLVASIVQFFLKKKRFWSVEETNLLCRSGELIAIGQSKKQAEHDLKITEERYQLAVDAVSDGLWDWSIKKSIIYFSPRYLNILGYRVGEIEETIQAWQKLVHEDDLPRLMNYFNNCFHSSEDKFGSTFRIKNSEGNYVTVKMKGKIIKRDHSGNAIRAVGTLTDMTASLDRSRELSMARFALDHSPDQIQWLDENGTHRYVNHAFCEQLGYSKEEAYKLNVVDVNPTLDNEKWHLLWQELTRDKVKMFETLRKRKNGETFPVEVIACYLEYEGGGYLLYAVRDITDRRQTVAQLNQAMEKAKQANEAKSFFLANMSHEIRTPMNAIMGLTHLIMDTPLSEKQREYLNKINVSAENLLHIVNDIIDFSKIEAKKLVLEQIPFNLLKLVDRVRDLLILEAEEKNITLNLEVSADTPFMLIGDPLRLGQILTNLTHNAVRFTDYGSVSLLCKSEKTDLTTTNIAFSISDTGLGIPEDKIDSLFESFSQLDNSTTRKLGGTGLGLSICKNLVEMMGGKISVKSEVGIGSVFSFQLQFKLSNQGKYAAQLPKLDAPVISSKDLKSKDCKVLVVEDNEINRQIAKELLHSLGVEVQVAESGISAVNKIKQGEIFDIIFMDIQMPQMDGYQTTLKIREINSDIPIIAMTAHATLEDKERCLSSGMSECLTKPLKFSDLKNFITRFYPSENETKKHDQKDIFQLPGIDTEKGLANLLNNKKLYVQMLHRFKETHKNTLDQFMSAIASEDLDSIKHIAHNLRGAAGTLGAEKLRKVTKEIESFLDKHKKNPLEFKRAFCDALSEVMTGLELLPENTHKSGNFLDSIIEKSAEYKQNDNTIDFLNSNEDSIARLDKTVFSQIQSKLKYGDISVIDDFKLLEKELENKYPELVKKLKHTIEQYDFIQAERYLKQLENELQFMD